jgi:NAD(P)-dependent dehydrogenase (short-subunit alcohol dehydrogenase family)
VNLLAGKAALVTGGSRGIGLAVAERFAAEGADVLVGDLAMGRADLPFVQLDVTDERSIDAAVATAVARFGRLDVFVANAGILQLGPLAETQLDAWERVLRVNLTGVFLTCRAAARHLVAQGTGGRVIATSSLFGRRGGRNNVAYSASKFGVVGVVETAAAELAEHGITVNAVCPGQVDTEMLGDLFTRFGELRGLTADDIRAEFEGKIPIGRLASTEEVANVFVFLASELGSYVTGQSIIVDGGQQVGP